VLEARSPFWITYVIGQVLGCLSRFPSQVRAGGGIPVGGLEGGKIIQDRPQDASQADALGDGARFLQYLARSIRISSRLECLPLDL
jgi:hypothetical protein